MINKHIILGHVGGDPEVRVSENGNKIAVFSIATTEKWKDKEGNQKEHTDWHKVVCYRGLAEIIEKYVKKGSKLYIEARVKTRQYDKDGIKHFITEDYADVIKLLDSKERSVEQQERQFENIPEPSDEMPF